MENLSVTISVLYILLYMLQYIGRSSQFFYIIVEQALKMPAVSSD